MRRGGQGGRNQRFSRDSVVESAGPSGKIRGNFQQLVDRYVSFGKDALAQRDFTEAENYFQHAEHYRRLGLGTRTPKVLGHKEDDKTTMVSASIEAQELSYEPEEPDDLPSFIVEETSEDPSVQTPKVARKPAVLRARRNRVKKDEQID